MGKVSGKSLAEKYHYFLEPCVKVMAGGREILSGNGVYLERMEVVASVGMEPDMAILNYRADKFSEQDFRQIEGYLHVGQKMEVKAGYGDAAVRIFLGYLHEVEAADAMQDSVEYTLICLDVKGLMKKNSMFLASGSKKAGEVLGDILNTACYQGLVEEKKVDSLPKEWNQNCVIKGESHYDWLNHLTACVDYEFFCGRGQAVFRQARRKGGDMLELRIEYGLQEVRGIVTMAEQTGKVQVWGYNRKDEKVSGAADWPGVSGPFGSRMKQVLQGCGLTFLDMGLETGEQARQCAKAQMNRRAGRCSRMKAVSLGIPELAPGGCVEFVNELVESLSGTIYVEEVCHLVDGGGYRTVVEGVRV